MHWLDIILILALVLGGLLGLRSGLLWQVARIVIFLAAVYACIHHHEYARDWLEQHFTGLNAGTTWLAAYVVTFLGVCLAGFLVTWILEYFLRAAHLKPLDRLLGGLIGILKTALICGALLTGVVLYGSESTRETVGRSSIAPCTSWKCRC